MSQAIDPDVLGILTSAPASVTTPAGTVRARSAADAILLDQYDAAKAAATNGGGGSLRMRIIGQVIGPGGISPSPGQNVGGNTDGAGDV